MFRSEHEGALHFHFSLDSTNYLGREFGEVTCQEVTEKQAVLYEMKGNEQNSSTGFNYCQAALAAVKPKPNGDLCPLSEPPFAVGWAFWAS